MGNKFIGIFGRVFPDEVTPKVNELIKSLTQVGFSLLVFEPFFDFLKVRINLPKTTKVFDKNTPLKNQIEFMLCIGGDGTFLDSATIIKDSGIPILGINTGRLGFLSGVSINQVGEVAKNLVAENYTIYKRATLKLQTTVPIFNNENFALNEITIHKKDSSSMITIHTYLDDEFLNSYWADGLIVATPTGSTAYSLSCGGPIVYPGTNNFVITPVAPHNLNVRPIVIPDNKVIKLKIEGRSQFFLVSLDSRSETIDSSIELTITKNNFYIKLVRLPHHTYLSTIRSKLNWGLDYRNS